jgi:hypothetical protein
MRVDITFRTWIKEVDREVRQFTGTDDLGIPSTMWHEFFEEGYTPMQAAETALMNEGYHIEENYYLG